MRIYPDIGPAIADVRRFFYTNQAELPPHIVERLEGDVGSGSPVDLIVNFTEAMYANREAVPAEGLEVAAGTADLINRMGYHGRLDERAAAMVDVLRRDSKEKPAEGHSWPKKGDDPEVKADFAAPAPVAAPAAPKE